MKKAFPLKASDPNLCVWVHTEEYTDFIPTPGQAVTLDQYSPLSGICISGTRNFNDTYALQEYWEQWPLNIGNEIWDRRECYIDINSCNWTTDLG